MSGRLLVRSDDGRLASLVIGDSARIGFAGERLVVDDESPATLQASIGLEAGGRYIEAAGGSSLLVNGERVGRGPLRHLDVVSIAAGLHLIYLETRPKPAAEPPLGDPPRKEPELKPAPPPPAERTVLGLALLELPPNLGSRVVEPDRTMRFRRPSAGLPPGLVPEEGSDATVKGANGPVPALGAFVAAPDHGEAALAAPVDREPTLLPATRFLGTVAGQGAGTVREAPFPVEPLVVVPEKGRRDGPIVGVRLTGLAGVFEVPLGRSVVGRDADAIIRIDSKEVSRAHAVVSATPADVTLEDQQSANGTTVNGTLTVGPRRLVEGDRVSFGSFEFRVAFVRMDGSE